jgi:hypothetical protein
MASRLFPEKGEGQMRCEKKCEPAANAYGNGKKDRV